MDLYETSWQIDNVFLDRILILTAEGAKETQSTQKIRKNNFPPLLSGEGARG